MPAEPPKILRNRASWAAGFLAVLLSACRGASAPSGPPDSPSGPRATQTVDDFAIDAFVEGRRNWTLLSPRAEVFETEGYIDVRAPAMRFYEQDQLESTLEAGRGRIQTESKDVWAGGGVVLVSTDGARLTSEWLRYAGDQDRISSTAPVTITRRGSVIRGVGWEASPDLKEVVVHQQRVEIQNEDKRSGMRDKR